MEDNKKDVPESPMMSEEGKQELYMYSVLKMAKENSDSMRIPLTGLYGLKPFLFNANELMKNSFDSKFAVIRMDIYRFKTVNVQIILSSEVVKEEITKRNFLSDILTYSSKKYKTKRDISIASQDLYAANIYSTSYRLGNYYNTDINLYFLNEKYSEKNMTEKSLDFLSEIIFNPNVDNNKFDSASFNIVKNNRLSYCKYRISMNGTSILESNYSGCNAGYTSNTFTKANQTNFSFSYEPSIIGNSQIYVFAVWFE